ncbi:tyrosine-type recombinase/integrase [Lentisalinibacter sediminis]|uniref:tyrosine-type recombinase/integrase n=1 Tax=Lentisalinibacter sediminis TaxID=2992237 RepID=UPI00386471EB
MAKIIAFSGKEAGIPDHELRKVLSRPKNYEVRSREYLRADEVERLMKAAAQVGRHRLRDRTLILTAFRHGLRVSELIGLKWAQVDFRYAQLHVNRLKSGLASVHPIEGDELRLLRRLRRQYFDSAFVFTTERGGPLSRSTVGKLLRRAGDRAGIEYPVHPHMLRHGTGYYLANRGVPTRTIQAYLGHRSIQNTVRYTQLSSAAFDGLWG